MGVVFGGEEEFRDAGIEGEKDVKIQRAPLSPLPERENQAFSERRQVSERQMPCGAEALSSRRAWEIEEKSPGIRPSAQGEAEA